MSLGDQNRRTPDWLFQLLQKEVVKRKFKLDAAASKENALCKRFYTEETNGLNQRWLDPTFCNPGFANFGTWIMKAVKEARQHQLVACLIGPKGCSQKWYHDYAKQGTIYAPDQRLVFFDSKTGKPTPGAREDSMIYVLGPGFWNRSKTKFNYLPLAVQGKVITS